MFRFYFPLFIKLFMVLLCVIFTRGVLSIPACDVYVRLETTGAAIKIARGTTNHQQNKYNLVKHVQRQYFSFTKTSTESKCVSENHESGKH